MTTATASTDAGPTAKIKPQYTYALEVEQAAARAMVRLENINTLAEAFSHCPTEPGDASHWFQCAISIVHGLTDKAISESTRLHDAAETVLNLLSLAHEVDWVASRDSDTEFVELPSDVMRCRAAMNSIDRINGRTLEELADIARRYELE